MRKFAAVLLSVLFLGVFAVAQMEPVAIEMPKNEISALFAYQYAGLNGSLNPTNQLVTETSTSLQGFAIDYSHYFSHRLGFTLDAARVTNGAVDPTGISYKRTSGMGGPSYRLHQYGFFAPSVHILAGVDYAVFAVKADSTTLNFFNTDFAALAGGTVDGNLSKHIALRLAQVDYLYTHHYGASQSSFRYSGGVVFRF